METQKVRLYLDIDGCLNASSNARAWRTPDDGDDVYAGFQRGWGRVRHDEYGEPLPGYLFEKYSMTWNSRLIEALNALDVELVWTSTWRDDAPSIGTLMGLSLEPFRVLHPVDRFSTFPSIFWKLEAVKEDQRTNPGPAIWIDDELMSLGGGDIASLSIDHNILAICPDDRVGISPDQIDLITEFIGSLSTLGK